MTDDKTFESIQEHRSIQHDIRQMRENLDELEEQVRTAEWIELGGRGVFEPESCNRLCNGVRDSMDYIKDDIQELEPYENRD